MAAVSFGFAQSFCRPPVKQILQRFPPLRSPKIAWA